MDIICRKIHPDAVLPFYASEGAAAMDLTAVSCVSERPFLYEYGTGLSIEIPKGFVGLLFPRSSISKYAQRLSNCVGVIDSDYRGEIKFKFDIDVDMDHSMPASIYRKGDRIGQLMIVAIPHFNMVEGELNVTKRGAQGFGSTGL